MQIIRLPFSLFQKIHIFLGLDIDRYDIHSKYLQANIMKLFFFFQINYLKRRHTQLIERSMIVLPWFECIIY